MQTISLIIGLTFLLGLDAYLSDDARESFPRVNTPLGYIEGYYKTSSHGRRFEAYEGIPYAEPTTGTSRFGVRG